MKYKKAELTVEQIVKMALVILGLAIVLYLILKNTGAMNFVFGNITGAR